jgi:hypothetical protein
LAQQLEANQTQQGDQLLLSYRWNDRQQNPQALEFSIDRKVLKQQNQKALAYRPQIADRYAYVALNKAAAAYDYKQVRIDINKRPNQVSWEVSSDDLELAAEVKQALSKAAAEARENYYQTNHFKPFNAPWGDAGVIPDHAYFMQSSVEALKPLAQKLIQRFPNVAARQMADYLLPFIQSIPYVSQDSRATSAALSYLPPLRVLEDNQGDCDSKAVLLAAIMRAAYPQVNMAMIYMPNHAMLGLQIPYVDSDIKIAHEGASYLVAEVAGPAMFQLGDASASSKMALASHSYALQTLP